MKGHAWFLLGLLLLLGSAWAEGGCPHGMTPRNYGATVGCVPGGNDRAVHQQQQQQSPSTPRPSGYWEKTWGAIAPSPKGGVLGTALGAPSKQEAERRALADCKAKGGKSCKVDIAYQNQCAVMVLGARFLNTARAGSIKEASDLGMEYCKEKDMNCRVYYSACTEPIFHRY